MIETNGLIIDRANNGHYIVKTQDLAIYETFPNRVLMAIYILSVFKAVDCEETECKLCADITCEENPNKKPPEKPQKPGRISTKNK